MILHSHVSYIMMKKKKKRNTWFALCKYKRPDLSGGLMPTLQSICAGTNEHRQVQNYNSDLDKAAVASFSVILRMPGTDPHLLPDRLHAAPDAGPAVGMYYLTDRG